MTVIRSKVTFSYIINVGFSNGGTPEGAEALSNAADHRTEHSQQSCQFRQRHRGRGDVLIQSLTPLHVAQILNKQKTTFFFFTFNYL